MSPEKESIEAAIESLRIMAENWQKGNLTSNEFLLLGADKLKEWEISCSSNKLSHNGNHDLEKNEY